MLFVLTVLILIAWWSGAFYYPEEAFALFLFAVALSLVIAVYRKLKLAPEHGPSVLPSFVRDWRELLRTLAASNRRWQRWAGWLLAAVARVLDWVFSTLCFVDDLLGEINLKIYAFLKDAARLVYRGLVVAVQFLGTLLAKTLRFLLFLLDRSYRIVFHVLAVVLSIGLLLFYVFLPFFLYIVQARTLYLDYYTRIYLPFMGIKDVTPNFDGMTLLLLLIALGACLFPLVLESATLVSAIKRDLLYRSLVPKGEDTPASRRQTSTAKKKTPPVDSDLLL